MAKIAMNTIEKYNRQMKNGFRFDLSALMYRNKKQATLIVNLDEKHYLSASLWYSERFSRETRQYVQQMQLHISYYTREADTGMAVSRGIGKFFKLGEYPKKMFSEIIKKTAEFDAVRIKELYEQDRATLENPYANGGGLMDEIRRPVTAL